MTLSFYGYRGPPPALFFDILASTGENQASSSEGNPALGNLLVRDGSPPRLAWIAFPAPGAIVGPLVPVSGTTLGDAYTLEFRPDGAVDWTLAASGGAVVGDALGVLDLADVPPGPVAVRLGVVQDGEIALDERTLTRTAATDPLRPPGRTRAWRCCSWPSGADAVPAVDTGRRRVAFAQGYPGRWTGGLGMAAFAAEAG